MKSFDFVNKDWIFWIYQAALPKEIISVLRPCVASARFQCGLSGRTTQVSCECLFSSYALKTLILNIPAPFELCFSSNDLAGKRSTCWWGHLWCCVPRLLQSLDTLADISTIPFQNTADLLVPGDQRRDCCADSEVSQHVNYVDGVFKVKQRLPGKRRSPSSESRWSMKMRVSGRKGCRCGAGPHAP